MGSVIRRHKQCAEQTILAYNFSPHTIWDLVAQHAGTRKHVAT